ncbi:DapH/DapD/GlmU-related protein [Fusobacterium perfoetens]|uniref:acyltransferase n=1 Tax=Fusobacterium perfoetens TaxID=852 RepID=UPI0026F081AE|nr:acyltransferase [Fusobacterium perfoetens]
MIKLKYLKDRSIVKIKNGGRLYSKGRIRLSKVKISGENNQLIIEEGARINQSNIMIKGKNNKVIIKKDCDLNDLTIVMENKNGIIEIGEGTTCGKTMIVSLEPDEIKIGKNCMISYDVEIRNTDSHKIIDLNNNEWINKGKKVIIEDNVWIGTRTMILKGTKIKKGCIVGAGSILSKEYSENSLIVGNPAKIVKENISWNREEVFKGY